ncbi:hypothetical protein ACIPIX_05160 [Pseudomonas protegens]|uniref:hypothetical protein n=1 Tax=Pseudomonas protegens TaxID=380021 RepID=UPI0037F1C0B3
MPEPTLSIEVQLPKAGDENYERWIEVLAEEVYQRVKRRLEQNAKDAKADINDV